MHMGVQDQSDDRPETRNNAQAQAVWLRKATGWGLLVAGIAGCLLPVLPGIPLVIAGLLILARDYLWAKKALFRAKRWAVHLRRKARARRGAVSTAAASIRRKSTEEI